MAITDLTTGLYAHGAIMAALLARERTGRGQHVDLSLIECQVASLANVASNYLIGGKVQRRGPSMLDKSMTYALQSSIGSIALGHIPLVDRSLSIISHQGRPYSLWRGK